MSEWADIRRDFRKLVAVDGAAKTAKRMLIARKTVYRLITETENPRRLTVEAARKAIDEQRQEKKP